MRDRKAERTRIFRVLRYSTRDQWIPTMRPCINWFVVLGTPPRRVGD